MHWCIHDPPAVENAKYNKSVDNLNATYECEEGYESKSQPDEALSECLSSGPDSLWSWSPVTLTCTPGES